MTDIIFLIVIVIATLTTAVTVGLLLEVIEYFKCKMKVRQVSKMRTNLHIESVSKFKDYK